MEDFARRFGGLHRDSEASYALNQFYLNGGQIAWVQGQDLYSASSNRLLAGFEYTAKYNTGNDVPYTVWGSCRLTFDSISTVERGNLRPIYEMVFNHYVKRRSLPAPWTYTAIGRIRPEGAAFQCDHVGFGTLLFTL